MTKQWSTSNNTPSTLLWLVPPFRCYWWVPLTQPPLPTFTPLTKHNILLNMVKVKGSRVIDWLIVCCLYVPLYNLSHLLRRQYWRCITRTFSWALTFLYRATRSSNGFLNFHTYTVRELLSVICICRVIFNLSQTFYVI